MTSIEHHARVTGDGWQVALRRYRPEGVAIGAVVCGHGFGGSSLIYDIREDVSLARYLADRRLDTWLVDFRGRGDSWPEGGPQRDLQWSFDDFVRLDLPAAGALVSTETKSDRLGYIGQEMSGQVAYAAAVEQTAPWMHAAVTLGAPAITPPSAKVPGITAPPGLRVNGRVKLRAGAHFAGPILARFGSASLESSFRPANTDPEVTARYLREGVPDEATDLAEQFDGWVENGTFASLDGHDWLSRLPQVETPMLLVAGARDLQRPPAAVEATARRLANAESLVAGLGTGFSVDYGHDDLIASRTSRAEVFPLITDWLIERVG